MSTTEVQMRRHLRKGLSLQIKLVEKGARKLFSLRLKSGCLYWRIPYVTIKCHVILTLTK